MNDFAYILRILRERAGLNQKELAETVGYTASYISMLESRKKPPPSDEVVKKLAQALGVKEIQLLEPAHLERTPYDIKTEFQSLRERMQEETRTATWLRGSFTHSLLPLLLRQYLSPPAPYQRTPNRVPRTLRRFLKQLQAVQEAHPEYDEFRNQSSDLIAALDPEKFAELIEWLPESIEWNSRNTEEDPPCRVPIFIEIPWEPVEHATERADGFKLVPESAYSPSRYCIVAIGPQLYPKIEDGDYLIIDEALTPESGDLVALLNQGEGSILRYTERGSEIEFAPINPQFPPLSFQKSDLNRPPGPTLRGVVVEIHRSLR